MNFNLTSFLLANVLLALSYICYYFLLRNQKAPVVNRFFLLGGMLLSITVPFIDFSFFSVASEEVARVLPRVILDQNIVFIKPGESVNYWKWLEIITLSVSAIIFIRLMIGYFKIYFLIKRSTFEKLDGIYLSIQEKLPTFSFFNYIFLNIFHRKNIDVYSHELIHAKQKHSIDIILVECCKIAFWYNPFIHLYKRSIVENHEFIADETVTNKADKKEYMELILQQAFQVSPQLTHPFINPKLLKRRIMMIQKTKNKRVLTVNLSIALAVALSIVTVVSCNKKEAAKEEIRYSLYEEEGQQALYKYIAENTKYPEEAEKKGLEGKVFVQFIINEEGKIENPSIAKGVSSLLDKEALRVISSYDGSFKPVEKNGEIVREQFTLPVVFKLTDDQIISSLGLNDITKLKDSNLFYINENGNKIKMEVPEKVGINKTRDKLIYSIDGKLIEVDLKTVKGGLNKYDLPLLHENDKNFIYIDREGDATKIDKNGSNEWQKFSRTKIKEGDTIMFENKQNTFFYTAANGFKATADISNIGNNVIKLSEKNQVVELMIDGENHTMDLSGIE